MSKPFQSIDDQFNLLQSRGIVFEDESRAKFYLLNNNYYNIVNCYGKFFINTSDRYIAGTSFNEITNLHYFDKEIKYTLFKFIIETETRLKSIISHIFCENHQNQPYPYLDKLNFKNDCSYLISVMSDKIKEHSIKKENNSIKHYAQTHSDVPLWILSNYLTFGEIVKFYKSMKTSEQNQVVKEFASIMNCNLNTQFVKLNINDFITFLNSLVEVRNIVAHNNKILDFKCRKSVAYVKELHSLYSIKSTEPRQSIYSVFIILQCFLSKNQYAILHNTILKRTKWINNHLSTIDTNKILAALGFPNNWHLIASLPQ